MARDRLMPKNKISFRLGSIFLVAVQAIAVASTGRKASPMVQQLMQLLTLTTTHRKLGNWLTSTPKISPLQGAEIGSRSTNSFDQSALY